MKITNVFSGRPQYYDRNPLVVVRYYSAISIGPNSNVTRWTYTVPSGRKCLLSYFQVYLNRFTVAAPANIADAYVNYTPNAQGSTTPIYADVAGNTVDTRQSSVGGGALVMLAGDNAIGVTNDGSTGGTFNYEISMVGSEFDA